MRILAAGIGNIFLGDDAFGVEMAARLMRMPWPEGVTVRDFGIRGLDLAYALMDGYDAFLLIDAVPRGERPGTLYAIDIDAESILPDISAFDAHSLDPLRVLQTVKSMGGAPRRVVLLGCEPQALTEEELAEGRMGMSEAVNASLDEAVSMAQSLLEKLIAEISDEQRTILEDPDHHRRGGLDNHVAA
jgi:hydrogenase maturation protease